MTDDLVIDAETFPLTALFEEAGIFTPAHLRKVMAAESQWQDDQDTRARFGTIPWFDIAPSPAPAPGHPPVHVALARVMAALPGIGKEERSPEGYQYRGIEAVTRHAQQAFAEQGIVIYPVARILRTVAHEELGMSNGWRETQLEVTWYVSGPAGDRLDPCPVTLGQGRDKSDKQFNKAMTQAFKYLLLQLLCIGDQKDETESQAAPADDQYQNHGRGRRQQNQAQEDPPPPAPTKDWIDQNEKDRLVGLVKSLPTEAQTWIRREWTTEDPMGDDDTLLPCVEGRPSFAHLTKNMVPVVDDLIARARQKAREGTLTPETPPAPTAPAEDATPAPTTDWDAIKATVQAMPDHALGEALALREVDPNDMEVPRMRATLVQALGSEAGLGTYTGTTHAPAPEDTPFDGSGGDAQANDEETATDTPADPEEDHPDGY